MLIMKTADWSLVARPIHLVCISLAEVVITPPPPVILWQVASQSYFSPVSHISLHAWLWGLGLYSKHNVHMWRKYETISRHNPTNSEQLTSFAILHIKHTARHTAAWRLPRYLGPRLVHVHESKRWRIRFCHQQTSTIRTQTLVWADVQYDTCTMPSVKTQHVRYQQGVHWLTPVVFQLHSTYRSKHMAYSC